MQLFTINITLKTKLVKCRSIEYFLITIFFQDILLLRVQEHPLKHLIRWY